MHSKCQRRRPEERCEGSRVANHQALHIELSHENDPKPEVLERPLADVEFTTVKATVPAFIDKRAFFNRAIAWHLVEDTAVDHVEDVHNDEALEHECLVLHSIGR